jgi:sugar lactone lactonase YvrE
VISTPVFDRVPRTAAVLGESPVWLPDESRVLWVDMPAGLVHRTDLSTGVTESTGIPTYLGAAAPRVGGGFVAAVREGFATISASGDYRVIDDFLPLGQRMNDAKCDPFGNFVAGSVHLDFATGGGALHLLSPAGERRLLVDGLTQPNGLAWSKDGRTFYLIDSAEQELTSFSYGQHQGELSNRRLIRSFATTDGFADGMTIDEDGCLWIALWDGAQIQRIAPDGELLETVPVPVARPSSCTFVGTRLDVLAITSADVEPASHGGAGRAAEGGLATMRVGHRGMMPATFGRADPETIR